MIAQKAQGRRMAAGRGQYLEDVLAHGVDSLGVLVQNYDTAALDASVLLAPLLRFLPRNDPRLRAPVLAIADELTADELVLRYRVDETDEGFTGEEATFTICTWSRRCARSRVQAEAICPIKRRSAS